MKALNAVLAVIAAIVVVFLVAKLPPPSPEMTESEIAQIEAEVLEVADARFEALRNLDLEKVLQSAHPDLLAWAAGGRILNSAAYREGLYAWAAGKESWRGGWVQTNVRVLTPKIAVFSGTYVDTIQYSDGREVHCRSCSTVFLFERTAEGWKYPMGSGTAEDAEPVDASQTDTPGP